MAKVNIPELSAGVGAGISKLFLAAVRGLKQSSLNREFHLPWLILAIDPLCIAVRVELTIIFV